MGGALCPHPVTFPKVNAVPFCWGMSHSSCQRASCRTISVSLLQIWLSLCLVFLCVVHLSSFSSPPPQAPLSVPYPSKASTPIAPQNVSVRIGQGRRKL